MDKVRFATATLTRAVTLDTAGRYTESLICYQEGLQMLMEALKFITDETSKAKIRAKAQEYMDRGEKLKKHIESLQSDGKYREQIKIEENSVGHSYESIFSRFLDNQVTNIHLDDPYIRSPHQCHNFLRFVELVIKKCPNLRTIYLLTGKDDNNFGSQQSRLDAITKSAVKDRHIVIFVKYSDSLHDREIRLDNGWVIKIGRGMDYFKQVEPFTIGYFDYDLRPCKETMVDVFHRRDLVKISNTDSKNEN